MNAVHAGTVLPPRPAGRRGGRVDDAVAGALLDALTPGQVALALSAADEVAGRHQRASRAAELAVERARYDADRAERAFCAVEPENRLVARSLEARWEARLTALAEAEQALQAAQDTLPPLPSRADLEKLAADLPALWNAPTTSARDRKRLLRTLIADVTVLPEPDRGKVRIGIRWHTGATDELRRPARPPRHSQANPGRCGRARPPARAGHQQRRAGHPAECRRAPYRPRPAIRHRCGPVDPPRLQDPRPDPYGPGEISVAEAARRLGCSTGVIYHWIHTGQLTARRGQANRFCIPWNAQAEAGCRSRIAQSAHLGRTARPRTLPAPAFPAADAEISVTEAACQLGCSAGVIYYWIETGQLSARRGAGNRLHIPWNDQIQAVPQPHRAIRAPQSRRPAHQAPPAALRQPRMSVPPAMLTSSAPRTRA